MNRKALTTRIAELEKQLSEAQRLIQHYRDQVDAAQERASEAEALAAPLREHIPRWALDQAIALLRDAGVREERRWYNAQKLSRVELRVAGDLARASGALVDTPSLSTDWPTAYAELLAAAGLPDNITHWDAVDALSRKPKP